MIDQLHPYTELIIMHITQTFIASGNRTWDQQARQKIVCYITIARPTKSNFIYE